MECAIQHITIHSLNDQNFIFVTISLINKHPIIKLNAATSQSYLSFVHSVKHEILCDQLLLATADQHGGRGSTFAEFIGDRSPENKYFFGVGGWL